MVFESQPDAARLAVVGRRQAALDRRGVLEAVHDLSVAQVEALGIGIARVEALDRQDAVEVTRDKNSRFQGGLDLRDEEETHEGERSGEKRPGEIRPAAGRQET